MTPWETIERATTPGGTELVLARRGEEWVVRASGQVLMSSRVHGSEETLAKYALERVQTPRKVLVGGLGLGFTLRAALDLLPRGVNVEVVELVSELVRWNQMHLGHLTGDPTKDPRVTIAVADVYRVIADRAARQEPFDLILLDVDNGPSALTEENNARLYSEAGARTCAGALRSGGVLALWSASADERYRRNLGLAGLTVEMKTVAARPGSGARDVLFLAKKAVPGSAPAPRSRRASG